MNYIETTLNGHTGTITEDKVLGYWFKAKFVQFGFECEHVVFIATDDGEKVFLKKYDYVVVYGEKIPTDFIEYINNNKPKIPDVIRDTLFYKSIAKQLIKRRTKVLLFLLLLLTNYIHSIRYMVVRGCLDNLIDCKWFNKGKMK